jgi:hypothetical protein
VGGPVSVVGTSSARKVESLGGAKRRQWRAGQMPRGVRIVTTSPTCAFKSTLAIGGIHKTPRGRDRARRRRRCSRSLRRRIRPPPWDRSRCRHRLRNVFGRAATKRCDRPQQDLALAEQDAELFEIGLAQLGQIPRRRWHCRGPSRRTAPARARAASRRSPRTLQILRCPLAWLNPFRSRSAGETQCR